MTVHCANGLNDDLGKVDCANSLYNMCAVNANRVNVLIMFSRAYHSMQQPRDNTLQCCCRYEK